MERSIVTVFGLATSACGELGSGQAKAKNTQDSGTSRSESKLASDEIGLQELNEVIAKFDQLKLMKRLGRWGKFDFETKKISTSSDLRFSSGLQCEASDSSLKDVKCSVNGYGQNVLKDFPPGQIGAYYWSHDMLVALCDLAPGEWVLSNSNSRVLVKPNIEGLPTSWECWKPRLSPGF